MIADKIYTSPVSNQIGCLPNHSLRVLGSILELCVSQLSISNWVDQLIEQLSFICQQMASATFDGIPPWLIACIMRLEIEAVHRWIESKYSSICSSTSADSLAHTPKRFCIKPFIGWSLDWYYTKTGFVNTHWMLIGCISYRLDCAWCIIMYLYVCGACVALCILYPTSIQIYFWFLSFVFFPLFCGCCSCRV